MCVPGGRGAALRPGRTRSAEGPGADQDPERPLPAAGLPGCQAGHRGRDPGGGRARPDHQGFGQRGGPERAAHRIRRRHGGSRPRPPSGGPVVSFPEVDSNGHAIFDVAIKNAFKNRLGRDASVVVVSISTTKMAAENYGIMGPVKAALDSSICFLAKSFSTFSNVRFNSVNPGLLKTSASAGIPGYADYYLYAEKLTLRKKGVTTPEFANAAAFLLSERASAINAQGIVLDAGMSVNYFDKDIMKRALRPD